MRIGRSLPPAAAPISFAGFLNGLRGLSRGQGEQDRFEAALKEYFHVRHCFVVSSGTAALTVILKALKELVPGREEVIIPAYTCYSVPAAVIRAGLTIRLCDIERENFGFNPDHLAALVGKSKPLCLVPTHLYGLPCPLEHIESIARAAGALVVEDAAQAMGAEIKGYKVGCRGDVGFYSLGRGKAFSTVEGGIIVTNDDHIARYLRQQMTMLPVYGLAGTVSLILRSLALNLLLRPSLFWLPRSLPFLGLGKTVYDPGFGLNAPSPFQAGLARDWPKKLQSFRGARRRLIERWQALADESRKCKTVPGRTPPADLIRFPLCIEDAQLRERILQESDRSGLGVMPGYPTAINQIEEIAHCFQGERFPVAEQVARELVTLPVHPLITPKDAAKIEKFVKQW